MARILGDFSLDATSPARESVHFFARDSVQRVSVGAKWLARNVATPGQVCKEGKFAKGIARFANLDST